MAYDTLISASELASHLSDPDWVIVDCRFSLADTEQGRQDYLSAHIPGAVYAHLDEDLSGRVNPGKTSRHPLPEIEKAARVFSEWGIGDNTQVVSYDDAGGALAAVRLWWMLRWLGHDKVAVLDGGWQAWLAQGFPARSGSESRPRQEFKPRPRPEMIATTEEIEGLLGSQQACLVDARTADRYRGENEAIDPVAGHIPGALNLPYPENLTSQGIFRSPEVLRRMYQGLLGNIPSDQAIFYCGSGVTSIHNILAMVHAGLKEPRLYAGSWSEWITDPERAVEVGDSP
jgi:thiosulfate/3-mercaptopyruvate sulfurtransferase